MRPSTGAILITCIAAVVIGIVFYFYTPTQSFSTQPVALSPTQTPIPTPTNAPQTGTVAFRILDTGTHAAGVSERKNYVAYSQEDFAKIWTMAHGSDGTPVPTVDFSTEYVIGVFAGQKPTSANSITVSSVTDTQNARNVVVMLSKPGTGCMTSQIVANPYQIVALPLSIAPLTHTDTEVAVICN